LKKMCCLTTLITKKCKKLCRKEPPEIVFPMDDEEKRNKRLAKNRESARNSRKRKKLYLQHLEERVSALTEEVAALTQELETTSLFPPPERKYKGVFLAYNSSIVETIKQARQTQTPDEELKALLSYFDSRRGATGVERQGYIEYLLNSLVDVCLPTQLKHLVTTIKPESSGFSSGECPWDDLFSRLDLTPEQKEVVSRLRQEFLEKKLLYSHVHTSLQKVRKCLLRRSSNINECMERCLSSLSPSQICDIVLRFSDETLSQEVSKLYRQLYIHNNTNM
jgi:hypothetical protein